MSIAGAARRVNSRFYLGLDGNFMGEKAVVYHVEVIKLSQPSPSGVTF